MDPSTLTLYLVAGGLIISLSLLMMGLAHLRPGAQLLKRCAMAFVILSLGFAVSGVGPALPRWMTVIGTNMVLISAGVVLYSGFVAYCEQRQATLDRLGWALVALTALPFWYWGLIEPDGHIRSAVFSFALAVVSGRTALVIGRAALQHWRSVPLWALAILFGILSAGMAARGVYSLVVEPPTAGLRGVNPTSWLTVAWSIFLVSLMSVCIIWIEFSRPMADRWDSANRGAAIFSFVEYFRNKLIMLWAVVLILVLGVVGEVGLFYARTLELEEARLTQTAGLSNDAFVQHSAQVIGLVGTILHSVRTIYVRTGSSAETESFIHALPFDKATLDNVYVINEHGKIVVPHDPVAAELSVADRDYFLVHRSTSGDQVFIGSVEKGRVTGKFHFRVTRRIDKPDGSFAGVVLGTVNPESFSRYYRQLAGSAQNLASLVGTADRKLRARAPDPPPERWQVPVVSPLWDALGQSSSGSYKNTSSIDQIRRVFAYRKVGDLPLVMVTGYSDADLQQSVLDHMRWLLMSAFTVLGAVLILAAFLTVEIRRRNEQNRFLAMLSHELKTPLSVMRIALGITGPLSERTHAHAQQAVQDMDAIVERCLEVDRLQQRRHAATRQPCRLDELLAELQAASTGADRLAISAADLPAFTVDTQLLRIALGNLIDNALKYAPANSVVQISARTHVSQRQPGILINIANDPGSAGMPDPRQVFKKYYRSPGAHSKTGSGLGLYLVRGQARRLGGWVRYAPTARQVRFEFWVPV
ncbi:MAG: ATP-binding protein [Rhodoferax sp.]